MEGDGPGVARDMTRDGATIDESLYNRQLYVLGNDAMKHLSESSVLVCGVGGLGIEIAKNLVLMGVKQLDICDDQLATESDLGLNFFLKLDDIRLKRTRAEASCGRLQELNPYVTVQVVSNHLKPWEDLEKLTTYQVVVLTECLDLHGAQKLDEKCRSQSPPVKFILSSVVGIAGYVFCDFGNDFLVADPDGEDKKDIVIGSIVKGNQSVVTTGDDVRHGLTTGDKVLFKDVVGLDKINGNIFTVEAVTSSSFSIGDGTHVCGNYQRGGFFRQVKDPVTVHFQSLDEQLSRPTFQTIDFAKEISPPTIHIALLALNRYVSVRGELPHIRDIDNARLFLKFAEEINQQLPCPVANLDQCLLKQLSFTARGQLCCISSLLGGIIAQEVVKAVTHKFSPLNQWLFFDGREVGETGDDVPAEMFTNRGDRYDALRACVGEDVLHRLAATRLFMVGCGAIGCEMLKSYALLGIATGTGLITVTDKDIIEKSNLCRQFLFRMHDISRPKSVTAAKAAHQMNPDINLEVHQHQVWQDTENIFSDAFLKNQHVAVNALDNLESRRYMDRRCVRNKRPLLDSGTMGCKGHMQVVLPHLTEPYSSQSDPPDQEYPYCTIKSFPSCLEHTVQWAREKFENLFYSKPLTLQQFWSHNGTMEEVAKKLEVGVQMKNMHVVAKLLETRPHRYEDCIAIARLKFEKYFNFKAKQLLHIFPIDTLLKDGTPFWQSPKRPPTPIEFDPDNELHLLFVTSASQVLRNVWNISASPKELEATYARQVIGDVKVPKFSPNTSKVIETEESATKPSESSCEEEDLQSIINFFRKESDRLLLVPIVPQQFEKDDDMIIDFVQSAAGLRSAMYSLEPGARLEVKRIAGSIIPAIASTTAAVAGLASLELLKIVKGTTERSDYKNCFLNLALPALIMSEPAAPQVHWVRPGLSFTVWDQWTVQGSPGMLLKQLLEELKEKSQLNPTMVLEGSKIIWMPILPGHAKRVTQAMSNLLKPGSRQDYVDLSVTYNGENDDVMGPPVRYYFNQLT